MTIGRRYLPLAIVAAVLTPLLLLGALCYRLAVADAESRLGDRVALVEQRTLAILASAETTMQQLAPRVQVQCTAATIAALRDAVYDSLYIRGAELIVDGEVLCNDYRLLDPPMPIAPADLPQQPAPALHISMPLASDEDGNSIRLTRRINERVSLALRVNPLMFIELAEQNIGEDQVNLALVREDGRVLARIGGDEPQWKTRFTTRRDQPSYGLHVVAWGSGQLLRGLWQRNTLTFMPVALLMSLLGGGSLLWLSRRRLLVDQVLRDALERDEFRVHYQPVHTADGRHCIGAEALIRWQHPQRGLLLPDRFIPLAEETGFIVEMTYWIMREVRRQMTALTAIQPNLLFAINISPDHFSDPRMVQTIRSIFGQTFQRGRLSFEITERQQLEDEEGRVASAMQQLRDSGAAFVLDDFGSGHAGLSQLAKFSFDGLKIDKIFIDAIGTDSITSGLVIDIIALAKRLNMKTVAEGVETAEQLAYLQSAGADYIQGWLFSPAVSAAAFADYLQQRRKSV